MLNVELDKTSGVATLRPDGALSEKDFESASKVIDTYLEENENLKGIIINTRTFPGWESFGSFVKHFNFINDHHKKVSHIALVTDSVMGNLGEKITGHFISAEIKHFAFNELDKAQSWVLSSK